MFGAAGSAVLPHAGLGAYLLAAAWAMHAFVNPSLIMIKTFRVSPAAELASFCIE
jgi:hypothetical protein